MGKFYGEVETRWLDRKKKLNFFQKATSWIFDWDGAREMELLSEFRYQDDDGQVWTAYRGEIVDGASIPKFFWKFIGSPLVGDYRNASVIHDVYCNRRERSAEATHKVFCEMLKYSDVPLVKRKLMCFAVKRFGPKW